MEETALVMIQHRNHAILLRRVVAVVAVKGMDHVIQLRNHVIQFRRMVVVGAVEGMNLVSHRQAKSPAVNDKIAITIMT